MLIEREVKEILTKEDPRHIYAIYDKKIDNFTIF